MPILEASSPEDIFLFASITSRFTIIAIPVSSLNRQFVFVLDFGRFCHNAFEYSQNQHHKAGSGRENQKRKIADTEAEADKTDERTAPREKPKKKYVLFAEDFFMKNVFQKTDDADKRRPCRRTADIKRKHDDFHALFVLRTVKPRQNGLCHNHQNEKQRTKAIRNYKSNLCGF